MLIYTYFQLLSIDPYFQILSIITFILTIIILSYYLNRIRILNTKIKDSSDVGEKIIIELKHRLSSQDQKIVDLEVNIDIIELKINRFQNQNIVQPYIKSKIINKNDYMNNVVSPIQKSQNITKITETKERILNSLKQRDYTAIELQNLINKTREHTSRILKELYVNGYIMRKENNRPYIYQLRKKDIRQFE